MKFYLLTILIILSILSPLMDVENKLDFKEQKIKKNSLEEKMLFDIYENIEEFDIERYHKDNLNPDVSGEAYRRFINRLELMFVCAIKLEYKEKEEVRAIYTFKDFLRLRRNERPGFPYEDWKFMKEQQCYEAIEHFKEKIRVDILNRKLEIIKEIQN